MTQTESAILRFRRDLTFGRLLKGVLAAAVVAGFVLPAAGVGLDPVLVLSAVGCVWLVLSFTSAKGSRLAADSPSLIAAGQYDEAEQRIEQALRSFSLFRTAKLMSLHHLAVLRHAQRRWQDAALLCKVLLGQRLGTLQGLSKPSRLMLAEALLEMGDARGAEESIRSLYSERLSLAEVLKLLCVQLDCQSRVGAWQEMMAGAMPKVQMSELMPTAAAARCQALLALAAQKIGRQDWAVWLRRRAELLVDTQRLASERPVLWELWEKR